MPRRVLSLGLILAAIILAAPAQGAEAQRMDEAVTQGALRIQRPGGEVVECPLLHTDVKADIAGFIARVRVKQTFHNPTNEKIEAVYVFPLPHESAVDDMTMVIGERRIVGLIRKRDEARSIYERALAQGQTAALLEQERPNIFTQSVGNIEPGQRIDIEISYVDVLAYDMGSYEFRFPMVVGPRYVPGNPLGSPPQPNAELEGKVGPMTPDTDRVPDASRINPPVLKPGERTGHDISLTVNLNAGVPVQGLESTNHIIDQQKQSDARYTLAIHRSDTLPNKDFVLRYKVMGEKPEIAVLTHQPTDPRVALLGPGQALQGYFMLMVQPKEDERLSQQPPREIVFLVDVSGSMSGAPTEKVKQAMSGMLKLCRADRDTMQLITFAGSTSKLFEQAVPVNEANMRKALSFTEGFSGSGGTNMLEGVKAAIDAPLDPERVRIIIMLTDGYIGNESEIIAHVGRNCGDRVRFWAIGIGSSPNMMLVEGVARQGGGMGKVLGINDDAVPLAQEIMTRIQRAQLSNVRIDFGGLTVSETFPRKIPELWAGRPIVLFGKYQGGGPAVLTLRGEVEGQPTTWTINITFPSHEPANDQLSKVWARKKIEDLMQQTYYAGSPEVERAVTQIALEHRLMSPYTSFVAVDEKDAAELQPSATPPRRMLVPVPLPAGTRYEGFFGGEGIDLDGEIIASGPMYRMAQRESYSQPMSRLRAAPRQQVAAQPPMAHARGQILFDASSPMNGPVSGADGGGGGYSKDVRMGEIGQGAFGSRTSGRREALPMRVTLQPAAPVTEMAVEGVADMSPQPGGGEFQALRAAAANEADLAARTVSQARLDELGKQAAEAAEAGRLAEAQSAYLRLYFLALADHYRFGQPWQPSQHTAAALQGVEAIRAKQITAWTTDLPVLDKRLDLVIRDQSLADSLKQVSEAAGVSFTIIEGSLADSADLLGVDEARVSFLDLRHATVAQALDWLCLPGRLGWWVEEGVIRIASERRREGARAWVYDVAVLAWPASEELAPAQPLSDDPQKRQEIRQNQVKAVTQALEQFLTAMRTHLNQEAQAVEWCGDGMLLIIGSPQAHERAAAVLSQLADPKAAPPEVFRDLHAHTARRAEARKEAMAQRKRDAELYAVAARLDAFTWPLLAAAASGEVDLEALTELRIAWQSPRIKELVEGEGKLIAMRSMWAICESARALEDGELRQLSEKVREIIGRTVSTDGNYAATLYLAMARPEGEALEESLREKLLPPYVAKPPPMTAEDLLVGLVRIGDLPGIGEPMVRPDAGSLSALIQHNREQIRGEDLVVLTALAARKAGGEAWETFRIHQPELLGQQPLPGSVVVLVNRLASPRLSIFARAE